MSCEVFMEFIETEKVKPGNDVSMSKFKDFFGLLSYDKDFKLMEGERVQKDGTIIRYVKGLIDGNVYDNYGNVIYSLPAIEHKEGFEYWTKGWPQGFPAIAYDGGYYEEYWADRTLLKIKEKNRLMSITFDDGPEIIVDDEVYKDLDGTDESFENIFDGCKVSYYLSSEVKMSFQDRLKKIMQIKKLKDTDVYKSINMNEKTFNKVKNAKPETSVSYENAVMIAFGLKLTFDQMVKFVNSSGKGFRNYGRREEIVREFFENENYDIQKLNKKLAEEGEKVFLMVKGDNVSEETNLSTSRFQNYLRPCKH